MASNHIILSDSDVALLILALAHIETEEAAFLSGMLCAVESGVINDFTA